MAQAGDRERDESPTVKGESDHHDGSNLLEKVRKAEGE